MRRSTIWVIAWLWGWASLLAPAAQAATVLTVMDWKINETEQTQRWFQYVKERFEAEHPGVEIEYIPVGWAEVREKLLTGLAAGTAPDVVSLSIVWARELYEMGALRPLNDLIERTPELHPSHFIPVTQRYNQKDGVYFGITNAMDSAALLYDMDAFEMAGIDPSPEALASWDDFVAAARRLIRLDAGGAVSRYAYSAGLSPETFNSWLVANGGSFYDETLQAAGFASSRGLETARFLRDLYLTPGMIGGTFGTDASMGHGGNWSPYFLMQSHPDLRFNLTSYPPGPSGQGRGTTTWGNMSSITSTSQNVALAWEYIRWYTSLEGNIEMFRRLNYVNSPRLDFYQSDEWFEAQRQHHWMPNIPKVAIVGGVYPFIRWTDLDTSIWAPIIFPALSGQSDIDTVFREAERLYNQLLSP